MSYILDALNKAERDRQVSRVPGLATAHGGAESVRRFPWPWVAAGALAVASMALSYGLWGPGRPEPVRESVPQPAVAASSSSTDHGPSPVPADDLSEPEEAGGASAPDGGHSSPGLAPARPRAALPAPPAKPPKAARAEVRPRSPAVTPSADTHETRRAGVAQRSGLPAAAVDGSRIPARRPDGDPVAPPVAVARPAAVPPPVAAAPPAALAPSPPPAAAAGQVARPVPAEPVTQLTLDVLVYSDIPAERLVFINGRKYVEGQAVSEDAVVEQITPDGAILRDQGRQVVLRPRLNPYARPGSP